MTFATIALALLAAARLVTPFNDGWKADGEPVTLPHTWNAQDGEDGYPAAEWAKIEATKTQSAFAEKHAHWRRNPAGAPSAYVRKEVVYTHALPDPKPNRRLFFKCGGAAITADVYVNGILVGRHLGAYTAFCYELTQQLCPSNNELAVVVDNRLNPDVPTTHADFTVFGGIYRDCQLIETDTRCIDPTWYGGPGAILDINPDGHVHALLNILDGEKTYTEKHELCFKDPVPWSPETPKTYTATFTLSNGDEIKVPFGFRTVGFDKDGNFCLNGQPLRLRGVNRHQTWPGKGWGLSAEDDAEDVRIMREMGVNAVRTAHYPQADRVYSLFDQAGIVAWCELPCTDTLSPTPAFKANVEYMAREMVAQLGNHPSIVMWSIFNELQNGWSPNLPEKNAVAILEDINRLFHECDPSRPTVAATAQPDKCGINAVTDALGVNTYPGWYWGTSDLIRGIMEKSCRDNARPKLAVSEYGSGANVRHHQWPIEKVAPAGPFHPEEYQACHHADQYRELKQMDCLWGTFVWVMFDFAADTRDEGSTPGINDKGLVTADRKTKKDAYYFYQANWTDTPVLHLVGARLTELKAETVPVLVFSNAKSVTLAVNGQIIGTQSPDEVKCVRFENVKLASGANKIALTADGLTANVVWTRK